MYFMSTNLAVIVETQRYVYAMYKQGTTILPATCVSLPISVLGSQRESGSGMVSRSAYPTPEQLIIRCRE